jgi:DNA repair exonuclease SbcCD ATPase subunit
VSRLQKEKAVAEKQQQQQQQQQNTQPLARQGTDTSTSTWHSHVNNLVRIASIDPYRNMPPFVNDPHPVFGAAYYRAWDGSSTGTSTRQPTTRAQTWIELALDRASAKKELELLAPKPADVERRQAELEAAQEELRSRLADVGRQSGEIGRHLEYTFYSLLEKLSSLVGTIHSFQSLSKQSRQLIANFEERTGELHGDVRKRVERLRGGFEGGEERVQGLEERCERAGKKAKELQTRLVNVRTIVENWEEREEQAARTWWRVWGAMFWGSVVLCSLVLGIVLYKVAWLGGRDPVAAGLGASPVVIDTGPGNHSLAMDIPEEVRDVLEGIEERRRGVSLPLPGQVQVINEHVERARDARLRVLDEL